MIDYSALLQPQTVVAGLAVANKKALLTQLAGLIAAAHGLDAKLVGACLSEREKIGSTGFGGGIAIPHAKLAGLEKVTGLFARLAQPVDFQAIDQLPVDLLFVMLSPPMAGADHLKALASVSRRLRDAGFVAKLRGAGSPDALYALWTEDGRDGG